jgi:zinc finger HIT domain-containing protein 1
MSGTRKSGRTRTLTDAFKLDDAQRRRLQDERIAALDSDNYAAPAADLDDEEFVLEDEEEMVNTANQKKKKKSRKSGGDRAPDRSRQSAAGLAAQKAKTAKCFEDILFESKLEVLPLHVPSYLSIGVGPSRYPPRNLCPVTGQPAKYACPQTGTRFYDLEVSNAKDSVTS